MSKQTQTIVEFASIDIEAMTDEWLDGAREKVVMELVRDFAFQCETDGPHRVTRISIEDFEAPCRGIFIVRGEMGIEKGSYNE